MLVSTQNKRITRAVRHADVSQKDLANGNKAKRAAVLLTGSWVLVAGLFAAPFASAESVTFQMKFAPHGLFESPVSRHGIARIGSTPSSSPSLMRHYKQASRACGALGGPQAIACQHEADRVLTRLAEPQTDLRSNGVQFNPQEKNTAPRSLWMKLT